SGSEIAACVRAETLDRPLVVGSVIERREVGLDPRLAQALAGAGGKLGDGGRLDSEQGSRLARLQALDLRVPEDLLPPGRKTAEGSVRDPAVEGGLGGALRAIRILDVVGFIESDVDTRSTPAGSGIADRGEEVRA